MSPLTDTHMIKSALEIYGTPAFIKCECSLLFFEVMARQQPASFLNRSTSKQFLNISLDEIYFVVDLGENTKEIRMATTHAPKLRLSVFIYSTLS